LILEDIHWSGTSLDILAQLIRLTVSQPLLIIASFRDDERPELPQKFPEMQVLKLHRLSQAGIAELAESMIGSAGRGEQLVTLLERETEGNVFFLVEVVRALAEESGLLDQIAVVELPQHVPSGGIRQIVQRRLNHVPESAKPLLEAAAVAGRMLDLAVLRRVDPAADIQHWLAMCSEAAVLEVQDERWRFAHDKLREGMLESLSAERKIELNHTIAQAIEAAYPESSRMAAALAYHWGQAGDRAKEARYALLAGKAAARLYADTQARKYFAQSADALASLPDTAESNQMRVDALVGLVSVSFAADSPETNLERLDQAETLVKALPGPDGTPGSDKRRLAHVLLWKGRILYYRGSPREAIAFFQQVLPLGKELGDEQLIANPASFIGQALITAGQFGKALPLLQQAAAPLERTGSWPEWVRVMIFWGLALTAGGDYVEGKRLIDQGYAKAVETKNLNAIGTCELIFALMYITVHDAQALIKRSLMVLENAQKTGDKLHLFWGHGFAGFGYCWAGDLDKASEMLETVQTIGATIGPRIVVSDWFAVLAAEIALRKGKADEALAAAEKAVEVTKEMGSIYTEGMSHRIWGQSLLLYNPPRLDEAEAQILTGHSLVEAGRGLVEAARCQVVLGRIYSQRNEPQKAREYLEKALMQLETTGLQDESSEVKGMLEKLRA
jgi:tetratricopeptide (TPR) repeat protein